MNQLGDNDEALIGEEAPLSPRALCRFQPGERVTWRGADADVPLGTVGVVLAVHLAQNDHHNAMTAVHSPGKKKKHRDSSSSSSSAAAALVPPMWSHDVEVAFPVPNALEVAAAGSGGPVTAVFTFAAERLDRAVEPQLGEGDDDVERADDARRPHAVGTDEDAAAIGAAQASLSPTFRRSQERAPSGSDLGQSPTKSEDLSAAATDKAAGTQPHGNGSVNNKGGETLREDETDENDSENSEKDVTQWTL